jgi:molybdate transport system regulatory protein
MSRPKNQSGNPASRAAPGLRVKIFVRDDMIGGGKVALLKLLAEQGSITAAAKAMGVDYRRAWFLLDTLQRCFEEPLFITRRGGAGTQGAEVTQLGHDLIARHDAHAAAIEAASADYLTWLATHQRHAD